MPAREGGGASGIGRPVLGRGRGLCVFRFWVVVRCGLRVGAMGCVCVCGCVRTRGGTASRGVMHSKTWVCSGGARPSSEGRLTLKVMRMPTAAGGAGAGGWEAIWWCGMVDAVVADAAVADGAWSILLASACLLI